MKKINMSNYFYLANNKTIDKKEISSGATLFNGQWVTNYNEASDLLVDNMNKLSIYVPSTIDVNKVNDNFEELTKNITKKLQEKFNTDVQRYDTKGAWKAEDNNIVYENINILTINATEENFENSLNYFISLAEQLKKNLTQEGISIGINEGLLII